MIDTQGLMKEARGMPSFFVGSLMEGQAQAAGLTKDRDSEKLREEVVNNLRLSFIPAVYNHRPVVAHFDGTITFSVIDGKAASARCQSRTIRIAKESDFIDPQMIVIPGQNYVLLKILDVPG